MRTLRTAALFLIGLMTLCFAQSVNAPPLGTVWNNYQLTHTIPAGPTITVTRLGFTIAGDAPPLQYNFSTTACSSPDNGAQVSPDPSLGITGCWIAAFTSGPKNDREWGAKLDGVTSDDAAIAACLAAFHDCLVPPSTNGMYISSGITIPAGEALIGEFSAPSAPIPSAITFAGQSWILCANSATKCLSTSSTSKNTSTVIRDLTITGVSGTPATGTIGVYVLTGYNIQLDNVYVYNRDTCWDITASGAAGLGVDITNPHTGACKTHWWYFDGWPEARITGGRTGSNGGNDYTTTTEYIYNTNSVCTGSGCGPNGIAFINHQFNPGGITGPSCFANYANYSNSGSNGYMRLVADHIENIAPGGSVFCSDNTFPLLNNIYIMASDFICSGDTACDLFTGLNAATGVTAFFATGNYWDNIGVTLSPVSSITDAQIQLTNNEFSGNPSNLTIDPSGIVNNSVFTGNSFGGTTTIAPVSGGTVSGMELIGNTFFQAVTIDNSATTLSDRNSIIGGMFASSDIVTLKANTSGNDTLSISDVLITGNVTVSGDWKSLTMVGNQEFGTLSNSATGGVTILDPIFGLISSGAGTASKYVCVDTNNKIITQSGAC